MKLLPILLLLSLGAQAQKGSSLSVYSAYPVGGFFHSPLLVEAPQTPQSGLGATGNLGATYSLSRHLTLNALSHPL